jgi:PEP-CTERM motif
MRKKIALLVPVICLAAISVSAKADPTTLTYLGSAGGNVGPYTLQLDGKNGPDLNLFCLDLNRDITTGETWNVTVESFPTSLGSTLNEKYAEEAYIYNELGQNVIGGHSGATYTNSEIQAALWNVFDPFAFDNDGLDHTALSLVGDAESAYDHGQISSAFLSQFVIYIPDTDRTSERSWTDGEPQDFIGKAATTTAPAPEPSSLVLLGSGLIGLAGTVRRKLARG